MPHVTLYTKPGADSTFDTPPGGRAELEATLPTTYATVEADMGRATKIPLGDAAAWAQHKNANATISTGTDTVWGDYIRVTNAAGTAAKIGRDLPVNLDGKVLSAMVRRVDANLTLFDLWMGYGAFNQTTSAKRWSKAVSPLTTGEWRRVAIPVQEWDLSAGVTPTNWNDLRTLAIQVTSAVGNVTAFDIADLRLHESPRTKGRLSFAFDDGRDDTYTVAYPILAAQGFPATIYVEHTAVGTAGRMTLGQLQTVYADGWDISGHHSVQMTSLSTADQILVHQASKSFLATNGFTRGDRLWAWPGGARTAATEATAAPFWDFLRRTNPFAQAGAIGANEKVDPPHFYITNTTTLVGAKAMVDKLAAAGGGHVVFSLHSLVTTPVAADQWSIADFTALVAYIAGLHVPVVALSAASKPAPLNGAA